MKRREFWDKCHRAYDALALLSPYRKTLAHAMDKLEAGPGKLILDAGSGTGNLSIMMRRAGARVISLDFSPVAISIHLEKDPHASVLQLSLEELLPLPTSEFDGVACLSVLFAISREGVRLALREFRRVLKPGGKLVITLIKPRQSKLTALIKHIGERFQCQTLGGFLREMWRTLPPLFRMLYYNFLMYALAPQGGYHRFTYEELKTEVTTAGFVDIHYESTYSGRFHLLEAKAPVVVPPRRTEKCEEKEVLVGDSNASASAR